jgi:hypothetical protein
LIKSSTYAATDKLCGLPRRIVGRQILFLFFTLAKAQSRIRRGGLCGLAALRANNFFFFYSRKDAKKLWSLLCK